MARVVPGWGVTVDATDITSVKNSIAAIKAGVPDAIRFATNDSLSAIKTAASREIRKKVTAKAAAVNKSFTIKKMYVNDLSANITCTGKPLPLINYKTGTQTQKGVKVQVLKQGSLELVKHAFFATMKSGHKGLFWRKQKVTGKGVWTVGKRITLPTPFRGSSLIPYQLPIVELYGPRIPDVLDDDEVMKPILEEASDRYDKRLKYHTERLLEKAKTT